MTHINSLSTYLLGFRNDIFKLLPMKEAHNSGCDNHLSEYLETLIDNAKGATKTFPELNKQRKYIYVTNNLSFLAESDIPFVKWRKTILSSTRGIDDLRKIYDGGTTNE